MSHLLHFLGRGKLVPKVKLHILSYNEGQCVSHGTVDYVRGCNMYEGGELYNSCADLFAHKLLYFWRISAYTHQQQLNAGYVPQEIPLSAAASQHSTYCALVNATFSYYRECFFLSSAVPFLHPKKLCGGGDSFRIHWLHIPC